MSKKKKEEKQDLYQIELLVLDSNAWNRLTAWK